MILEAAVLCLALNIYHEARGEMIPGQYAVAMVTLNRAKRDPEKVCEVVAKPKQFSWTISGIEMVEGSKWQLKPSAIPKEESAWAVAKIIARVTLTANFPDITDGATHFHAFTVNPGWRKAFEQVRQIGSHIFYR